MIIVVFIQFFEIILICKRIYDVYVFLPIGQFLDIIQSKSIMINSIIKFTLIQFSCNLY